MTTDSKNVTLNISLDSYGVSGEFDVDTEMSREQWDALGYDAQDAYATRLFNEYLVDWYWRACRSDKS